MALMIILNGLLQIVLVNLENLKTENLSLMFIIMGHGLQIGITQSFLVEAIMEIKIGLEF